ncbi:hypothetical protein [Urbifossiella limnaea]|uniref:Uncharacterized protein n=1 Tax=Urbifossiella limnaea TaxID=2528023 RepID=A0A517XM14_9BACT|nr:hypothetical protein [Urbifossiella limnaea]QDU18551.1 hypothetical protein ETAA1_04430 [Urbifossiella limnaea]
MTDPQPDPCSADVFAALLAPGGAVVALVGPGGPQLLDWLESQLGPTYHVARGLGFPPPPAPDEAELLDAFRAALQQRTADARTACEAAAARGERPQADERAVAETHGDGLVALLDGPTKDALFRDTPRRRSVFRQLLAGEAAEFAAADFEFADVNSARLADPRAQRYVAKLKTNLQGERAAAAALMNAARPAPPDPLARLREELARAGRELVVLLDEPEPGALDALAATDGPGRCAVRVALTPAGAPPAGATVFTLGATVEPEAAEPEAVAVEPAVVEPEPVVAEPVVVDARLGAVAVLLGRLPVPAPDDVVRFLAAAFTTGAELELLTPGVLEWLRAHGVTTGLRVRAG